jgi:uncharacterized protein YecE (DUF72 family)
MAIRIGLSGWSYKSWAGEFYPPALPQTEWLHFIAGVFPTVEVNRTFYSLLRPDTYRNWREQVPPEFKFSVKGSRYITHLRRLREVDVPLANFFASGILELGHHLDTVLWQFPANSNVSSEALTAFLSILPRSTSEAADLARGHDDRVPHYELDSGDQSPIRHAIELRSPDEVHPDVLDAARARNVAITMSHASQWPLFDEETADFAYLRLHGPGKLYHSGYSPEQLEEWSSKLQKMNSERDVLVYFDNDGFAHAPRDAAALIDLIPETLIR